MILETKAGIVAAGVVAAAALGAWASGFVAQSAQSSGVVIAPDLFVNLVMTAVIVGIAFGVLRSKVDTVGTKFDRLETKVDKVLTDVARIGERLTHHAAEIERLRSATPPYPRPRRRQPGDDVEDV
jgi:hypothetical protein